MTERTEDDELRRVALENARSVFLARQRAEEELVRAKDELARQSERLRVTLASIGDAVLTTDTDGRVVSLNRVAQQLCGWSEQEARGQPLADVFRIMDEGTRQPVENPGSRALREGRVVGLENHTVLVARDGTETPIDDSAAPIRDEEGHVHGVVLVFRSIAERRRSELALRAMQRELADFFENASVGLHSVGPDGVVLRVNEAELRMLGYSREEYVGRHIAEFHADRHVIDDILRRLGAGEILRDYPARLVAQDGSIKHVLIDSSVLWEHGQFIHTRCFTRDITDRKRADDAQARLAAIVESSQDAIISKTLDSRIVSWNAGADQLFGYAAGEVIGQSITLLIPPDRADEEPMILDRLRRGERVEHFDTVRVSRSGRRIDVSLTVSPIRDKAGQVVGASTIVRDVTTKKQAERRLYVQSSITHALASAASLLDVAPNVLRSICELLDWQVGALWQFDEGRSELRCTEMFHVSEVQVPRFAAASRERGFEHGAGLPGRVWAMGVSEWIPDVRQDGNFPRAAAADADGLRAGLGFPIVLDGRVLGVMEFFSHEIREPDQDVLHVMNSIGSQLGQFIERRRAEAAVRDSAQRFRFLADASAVLANVTDEGSTLQKVAALAVPHFADWCAVDIQRSDGSVERLGLAHMDPSKSRLVRELDRKYPSRPSDTRGVRQVIRSGEAEWEASIADATLVAVAQDDEHLRALRGLRFKSHICVPLKSRGQVLGAITFATGETGRSYGPDDVRAAADLADRAVIAIENSRLLASLKDADRRKDEFLAMLSHELRNPLAPIANAVQIFRAKGSPVPELQWATELIGRQLHHMTRMVDDLLDVSRITQGKVDLRRELVMLAAVVDSAVEASRPLIDKWGHDLTVTVPPQSIQFDADPTRLAQMVSNLLNNAAKYTPHGGRIELSAALEGGQVAIRVKDDGVGIPREMLPRVFDLFTQVDRSVAQSEGGLGIGLTLVRQLAGLHGGSVEAHSEGPGRGSEFVVRLPVAGAVHRDVVARSIAEPGPTPPSMRILVVDDNPDAADSLGMILRMMGHEVDTAHDGLEAVGAATTFRPDVVLLDIGLPKMSGHEVARRIRQMDGGADLTLVALTGWGQDEDRQRSKEAGFDQHLTKPVDFKILQKLLARIKPSRTPAS